MTDFHIHLLPDMDDGAQSVAESLSMLDQLAEQGVVHVVCTSHYFGEQESAENFLARRAQSYAQIRQAAVERGISIALGAEVAMWHGMSAEISDQLCLGESNLLLCELPVSFAPWVIDELEELVVLGFCPVIAHLDRVQALYTKDQLAAVLQCKNVAYQFNAGALAKPRVRGLARAVCVMGAQIVSGSDGHGAKYRAPDLSPAVKALKRLGMRQVRERMQHCDEKFTKAVF